MAGETATDLLTATPAQPDSESSPEAQAAWYEDLKLADGTTEHIKRFKTIEDALNGYANLHKLHSGAIALPKEGDSEEEKTQRLNEIYTKLGRPDKPENYKIEKPADLPTGLQWSDELDAQFRSFAHDEGFSNKQAQNLVNLYSDIRAGEIKTIMDAQDRLRKEATEKLKSEWGEKFGANLQGAVNAYGKYAGPELVELFDKTGLKNHPAVVKAFYEIYKDKLAEDNLVGGDGQKEEPASPFDYPNSPQMRRR